MRPYKETFNYDPLGHLTARPVNRVWAGPGGAFSPAQQTYQNERNTVWQYDADGNLTDSGYVQYTIDAAGQATRTVSQTIIPFNGDPNQHIRSIDADLTRSYDGDGNPIKEVAVETIHDDDDTQVDETTTTTTYQVRSTVLGKVMMETSGVNWERGFVYLGSEVIAWQLPYSEGSPTVNWEHRDPSNASFRTTPMGPGLKDQAELDPLGTNAGTSNPTASPSVRKSFKYPGFGDYSMRSDSQCTVDGFMQPCEFALGLVGHRAAKVDSVSGSVSNYMPVRVDDPESYDPDGEDPTKSMPNAIVTIHEHYHYELVYTGTVTTSFEPRQPQNPRQQQEAPQPCGIDVQLPNGGAGFILKSGTTRDTQFGTESTIFNLMVFAVQWNGSHPAEPLRIGEISIQGGGQYGEHRGTAHAEGRGVDIGLFRNDGQNLSTRYQDTRTYNQMTVQNLVTALGNNPDVRRIIFNDPQVTGNKLVRDSKGIHDNHIHVEFGPCYYLDRPRN